MTKLRKLLSIFTIAVVLFLALCSLLLVVPKFRDWSIRQQFALIDGAALVFEDSARWGANVTQTSIYYWVDRPLPEVRTYYQAFTAPFARGRRDYGEWEIALMHIGNAGVIAPDANPIPISHSSLCKNRSSYECVTIALVNADQAARHEIGVMSPSSFRRSFEPAALAELPRRGTIIIYSYYVPDW